MQILRRSALVVAATLFGFTLSTFILMLGVWQVFSTPDSLKQALDKSGIYQNVVGGALDQTQQEQGGEGVDLNNPEIKQIIVSSFPPGDVKQQTDGVIDNVYSWLRGDSAKLDIKLNFDQFKTRLADGLAGYASAKLNSLPPCTAANLPAGELDPINATCRPPGVNTAAEVEKVRQNILSGEFLKSGQVSDGTVKNDKGQTLDEQFKDIPAAYQYTRLGIIICGILAVALAAAIVLLSSKWRRGVHKAAVVSISIGAVTALLGWLLSAVIRRSSGYVSQNTELNSKLQESSLQLVQLLVNDLRNWWVGAGLALVVLGIATLVVLHFTKPKDEIKEEKAEKDFVGSLNDDQPEAWAQKLSESPKIRQAKDKPKTNLKAKK